MKTEEQHIDKMIASIKKDMIKDRKKGITKDYGKHIVALDLMYEQKRLMLK